MLIACNNKGCLKTSNALLDQSTMSVVCQECGKPITNMAESMKRTLKSFGQVVRDEKNKAFTMACRQCNANRQVVLDDENKTVCCVCGTEIKVHNAMKLAIVSLGERFNRQQEAEQAEEKTEVKKVKKTTRKNKE